MHTYTDNFYSLLIARRNTGNVGKYLPSQFWNDEKCADKQNDMQIWHGKETNRQKIVENVQIVRFFDVLFAFENLFR